MEYMKDCSDNQFDLAIVDPPYNINASQDSRFGIQFNRAATKRIDYVKKNWDNQEPTKEYFEELFRISKNQIIWGVNYYTKYLLNGGRIFWNKNVAENYTASRGELAYKSFGYGIDYFEYTWSGMRQQNMKNKENRIHPTQKPVALYKWLLTNYAKPRDKLFDSHSGSRSFRIAAHDLGFDLISCELDPDYYRDNETRYQKHIQQIDLFKPAELQKNIYTQPELI